MFYNYPFSSQSNRRFFSLRSRVYFFSLGILLPRVFCLSPLSSISTYNVTTHLHDPNINNTLFRRVRNAIYVTDASVVTRCCRLSGCPVVARPTNHYYLLARTPSISHRVYYADVLWCTNKICRPLPTARTSS